MNLGLTEVYVLISSFENDKDISITSKKQKEADNIYISIDQISRMTRFIKPTYLLHKSYFHLFHSP